MHPTFPASAALELPAPPASIAHQQHPESATARRRSGFALATPHSYPVDWLCSTCGATHSVLEILTPGDKTAPVRCSCDSPTLQAVYDQFGRIFLYWRNDPAIMDLRDPASVREAAWRVAEAAGGQADWLRHMLSHGALPTKLSQSSLSSSEDAEDIDISE